MSYVGELWFVADKGAIVQRIDGVGVKINANDGVAGVSKRRAVQPPRRTWKTGKVLKKCYRWSDSS
jgi:hypothetical protein